MVRDTGWGRRRSRRWILLGFVVLAWGWPRVAAFAEPVFVDPGSPVYRTLAVAAGRDADCGNRGRIEGNVHSNGNAKLHPGCRVAGDVSAVGHVHSHRGNVTGSVTSHAAPRSLPVIPPEAQLRALANRAYDGETVLTDATVDDVVFVRGKLRIRGSLRGTGTLIATGDIELDHLHHATLDPSTRLSLIARGDVELGKGRKLRAVIRAGHDVELEEGAELEGIAIATDKVRVEKATVRFASLVDAIAPVISSVRPADRSFATSRRPEIAASYRDDGSGVDPGAVKLLLDGTDRTADATVTSDGVRLVPSDDLAEGNHSPRLEVRDRAGNAATAAWAFTVDSIAPVLAFISPPSQVSSGSGGVQILVTIAESGSGADLASFRLMLDGGDATATCQVATAQATCQSPTLAAGPHSLAASLRDRAGNQGSASASFEIVPDTTPPTVGDLSPAQGAFVALLRPSITASLRDDSSGVDPASVRLVVDGLDRTAEAAITAGGLRWTPLDDLAQGEYEVTVDLRDLAGNGATASWWFGVDTIAPVIAVTSPAETTVSGAPAITIGLVFTEQGSQVDERTFRLALDGVDLGAGCRAGHSGATCKSPPLLSGTHEIAASAKDHAGNEATVRHSFRLVVDQQAPTLTLEALPAFVNSPAITLRGVVGDDGELASLAVNGDSLPPAAGAFAVSIALSPGGNGLLVVATDTAGREAFAEANVVRDEDPPVIELLRPQEGKVTNGDRIELVGQATDRYGIESLTINGAAAATDRGAFSTVIPLSEGNNEIRVAATDRAGNEAEAVLHVRRLTLPTVAITAPVDLAFVNATTVVVVGTVGDASGTVAVNGVRASLSGTTFRAAGVPLIEGGNVITATLTDSRGNVATDTIHVVRDLTPPRVEVYYPVAGATLPGSTTAVRGLVNDIVPGTVNASEVTVTVNGLAARVANRSFVVEGVPLAEGSNELRVAAVDESGNRGETSLSVQRAPASGRRIMAVGGDGQESVIGSTLSQPLVAQLLGVDDQPVPGRPVVFRVTSGDGTLGGGKRAVAVTTDAAGRAQATFKLGTRAGVANHVVEAASLGFAGRAVFAASATPGPPALIVVDSGGLQVGVAGQELPRPLVAAVVDAGANRLPAVPVTFRVSRGAGHFADGTTERVVTTDSDGRAITTFTLDGEEGTANNVVEALLPGLQGPVAGFVASGWAAGDPAATSVSGVVLDNTNAPVEGVTLRIKETPLVAVTNAQGQFRIGSAPVGAIKLVVDGSTATRPGSWPDLEYDLVTIAGRDTTVNMPIYLLPLDLPNGIYVDDFTGGSLTLPDFPGFELEVQPGSVTFPGGGRSGVVSVTVVHNDKVPMVPNFGQQPKLIVTIQPAGARFEPPARLTLPNVDGLAPGQVTEMYSYDHDLGHFVSIGPAQVSQDGLVLRALPGVGVIKAGWHCGGNPAAAGAAERCGDCQVCNGTACVPACAVRSASKAACTAGCSDNNECTFDDTCRDSGCSGTPVALEGVTATANGQRIAHVHLRQSKADVRFVASVAPENHGCPEQLDAQWDFGDGKKGEGLSVSHTYTTEGGRTARVAVRCGKCGVAEVLDWVRVDVYRPLLKLELERPIKISEDGEYFEVARVKAQMIKGYSGHVATDFTSEVQLKEATLATIYDQHGGELPLLRLKEGVGDVDLRSRAENPTGEPKVPDPAQIEAPDYEMFDGKRLEVPQWVDEASLEETHKPMPGELPAYDWFEAMVFDIRTGNLPASGVGQVMFQLRDFRLIQDLTLIDRKNPNPCHARTKFEESALEESRDPVSGQETWFNPFCGGMRDNGKVELRCVAFDSGATKNIIIHEARHRYQAYIGNLFLGFDDDTFTGELERPDNDDDGDRLMDVVPIAPTDIITDTTFEHDVCLASGKKDTRVFHGDRARDDKDDSEAANEWDAIRFNELNPP